MRGIMSQSRFLPASVAIPLLALCLYATAANAGTTNANSSAGNFGGPLYSCTSLIDATVNPNKCVQTYVYCDGTSTTDSFNITDAAGANACMQDQANCINDIN